MIEEPIQASTKLNEFMGRYIDYVKRIDSRDVYEGLSDKRIKKNKFIFKIYELEDVDYLNVKLRIVDTDVHILAAYFNSEYVEIGTLPLSKKLVDYIKLDHFVTIHIQGGNFKRNIIDDEGNYSVSNGSEPYSLSLCLNSVDDTEYRVDCKFNPNFWTNLSA
ncbi:hypothetical protein LPKW2_16605 (plasmid) [Lactiplantibacillus pentosus]|nr:hypothetical protein LPKW2_16605 [Lactiplantibacillus pentosus]